MKKIILLSLTLTALFGCSKNKDTTPEIKEPVCLVTDVTDYRTDANGNFVERHTSKISYDAQQRPITVRYKDKRNEILFDIKYTASQISISSSTPGYDDFGIIYHLNQKNLIERAENLLRDESSLQYTYNGSNQLVKAEYYAPNDDELVCDLTYNAQGIANITVTADGDITLNVGYEYNTAVPHMPVQTISDDHMALFPHLSFMSGGEEYYTFAELLYQQGYFGQSPQYAVKHFTMNGQSFENPTDYIVKDGKVVESLMESVETTYKTTLEYSCTK